MDVHEIAKLILPLPPDQRAALVTRGLFGFDALLGVTFSHVDPAGVVASLAVTDQHVQPYGLVHGGVYCALGETTCSIGAAFSVLAEGRSAVGVENTTRFLKGCRPGATLTVDARPVEDPALPANRRVWEARITDADGALCALSRVTTAVLEPGARIAGEDIALAAEPPPIEG